MDERFISRKQRRKMERKQKKERKDTFYRNKSKNKNKGVRKTSVDSNGSNGKKVAESDMEYIRKKMGGKKVEEKQKEMKVRGKDVKEKDDIDLDLEYLEGKLGLDKEENLKALSKIYTIENHDPDILEFLDNIDDIVTKDVEYYNNKKKMKSAKTSGIEEEEQEEEEGEGEGDDNDNDDEEIQSDEYEDKEDDENEDNEDENIQSDEYEENEDDNDDEEEQSQTKQPPVRKAEPAKPKQTKPPQTQNKQPPPPITQFQKEITSLLNKISESNLSILLPTIFSKITTLTSLHPPLQIYKTLTTVSINLLSHPTTSLPITSCICTFLSLCHYKYGDSFLLYYLHSLFTSINNFIPSPEHPKHKSKNAIFQLIHFYLFKNITSSLIYDLILYFIENFNEVYSEHLLLLLSYTGISIRKENPENLMLIISEINKKYNNMTLSIANTDNTDTNVNKVKYIIDMIDDIKSNKYLKFNLSDKFAFFVNYVQSNVNGSETAKKGESIETKLESIKNIDIDNLLTSSSLSSNADNTNNDHIGLTNEQDEYLPDDIIDNTLSIKLNNKMKRLNISTNLKKLIFTTISTSHNINDAFERITRLNLKGEQNREVIKMILLLCSEEKCFNPFYKHLLEKLMSINKDHKYTYHYCIWDYMKVFNTYNDNELKKIHNISKLTAKLLVSEKISFPVLLPFKFEESDDKTLMFVVFVLDDYFEEVNSVANVKIQFAKLIKNDEHVEFGKRLCYFLMNGFVNEVDLNEKGDKYKENYSAAVKLLKKIL